MSNSYTKERPNAPQERGQTFAVAAEPPIHTLGRKLIIGVAPVGAFVTKHDVPGVPNSPDEIVAAAIDCAREGASFVHIHCKTEAGILSVDPQLSVDTLQPIKEQIPHVIVSGNVAIRREHADRGLFVEPLDEILQIDPDLFDTYTLQTQSRARWTVTEAGLVDQVQCLEERGIKAELQCPTLQGAENVQRWLIDTGRMKMTPPFVNMHLGKDSIRIDVGEPASSIATVTALDALPKTSTRGVFPCGRNWLPTAAIALTQGVDFIRVGFDDAAFMWPHKPDQAPSTAAMVRQLRRIAEALGIEIATPVEARRILGLQVRSAQARAASLAAA